MKKKSKPSKLREKSTRIPSIQMERKEQVVREYLSRVSQRAELSEYARGVAFVQLLKDLLLEADPLFLQDYLQGMEHTLPGPKTALYNRGRVDALYGNLVIEFKRSLAKSLDEAREQLRKYVAALQQSPEDRRRPLIAIATDGIQFVAYAPRFSLDATTLTPQDIELVATETADVGAMSPEEVYYWLDRYFVRQTGPIAPRTKQIVADFGPTSGSFVHALNVLDGLWKSVERDSESQVFFDSWQKYLRITYGGPVADRELFLRHTYLATLAKVMVWVRLTGATEPPAEKELRNVLNGSYFSQRGIHNFLEEDFFAWVARDAAWPQALIMSRRLLLQLATYNLRELSEDVLKGLYEKLVDPKDRHDLGEYYTPDWLAAAIVKECLEANPEASVLDPACGSGTFLYQTILFKRQKLGDLPKTLKHIGECVTGIDIHPLAVIVAKTTYLLGLGDLLEKRGKAIRIPVYLADSIKPPEKYFAGYKAHLNADTISFPENLALNGQLYDQAIELCSQYASSTAGGHLPSKEDLGNFLRHQQRALVDDPFWWNTLYELFHILRNKIRERKDTIWAFILKNVFKPLLLKERFDVVIGNPPWLSYRYVEKGTYQDFLKQQITKSYQLLTGRPELLTHMELGTLFFVHSADLYLREGGSIAFVLPKSIFVADQHHALRSGSHTAPLRLTQVWDLEGVRPLFNVPASVAFGEKVGAHRDAPAGAIRESPLQTTPPPVGTVGAVREPPTRWPLPGVKFSVTRELPSRNASPMEAAEYLQQKETQYWLSLKGSRSYFSEKQEKPVTEGSPYRKKFAEGATMVPRSVWFVEIQGTSGLGVDAARPYVKTDPRAIAAAKDKYKDVRLEGNVEAEFLYSTLLSTDLVPFGHLPFRTVVLPILWKNGGYTILKAPEARQQGYLGLAEWLEKAEAIWGEKQGEKAAKMTVYQRLDRYRGLTQQRRKRYTVMYPDVNRVMFGAAVQNLLADKDHQGEGEGDRFFVDYCNLFADLESQPEAFYLVAMLNSVCLDRALQPFRRKSQTGHPHVMKKVWELAIPEYERASAGHCCLAELGAECQQIVANFLSSLPDKVRQGSLGGLRRLIREKLQPQIAEIDTIVSKIL